MRKVILTANDFEMFDTDISAVEFEFFQRHRDAFRRMWQEQGRQFWISFIMTFRKFAVEYGAIKEFPSQSEQFQNFIDDAFILLHENFVEVKVNQARSFLLDIVIVAQNKHTIQYLESKSYAKDPFYTKDTRDVFRRLFGAPTEKASYIKVYVLLPVFMKFGGAVCVCLRRWLDAEEIPEGESYEPIQKEYDPFLGETAARLQQQAFDSYRNEITKGNKQFPMYAPGWPHGRNPRFYDPKNPLYNPKRETTADWFSDMKAEEYMTFYAYCLSHYAGGKIKIAEEVDRLKEEEALKDIGAIANQFNLPQDVVEKLTKDSLKNLQKDDLQRSSESFAAYTKELEKGVPRFPLFVPDWPLFKDPRFHDEKNPLYNPKADAGQDWRTDVGPEAYQKFYSYVILEYGAKKKGGTEFKFDEIGNGDGKKSKKSKAKSEGGSTLQQEAFAAYHHEVWKGNPCYPTRVPGWPRASDPRFNDRDNPLYNPKAKPSTEWYSEIREQDFESFYRYVVTNYKDGVKITKQAQDSGNSRGEKGAKADLKESKSGSKSEESPERNDDTTEDASAAGDGKKKKKRNKKKKKAESVMYEKAMEEDLLDTAYELEMNALREKGAGDAATVKGKRKEKEPDKTEQEYKDLYIKEGKLEGKTYINYKKVHDKEHVCAHCSGCRHKHVHVHHRHVKSAAGSQTVVNSPGQKQIHIQAPALGAVHVRIERKDPKSAEKAKSAEVAKSIVSKEDDKEVKKETRKEKDVKNKAETKGKEKKSAASSKNPDEDDENDPERIYVKREKNGHRRPPASTFRTSMENLDPFFESRFTPNHFGDIIGIRDEWLFDDRLGINYHMFDGSRYKYLQQMKVVDPCSGLEGKARVVYNDDDIYSVMLMMYVNDEEEGATRTPEGKREYQKLQVLESIDPKESRCWVFCAFGTVGDTDGYHVSMPYGDKRSAIDYFKLVYEQRTRNSWENRKNFVKYYDRFYPVDLHECVPTTDQRAPNIPINPPRLKQDTEGLILLTTTKKRTDESGQVQVTMEKRVVGTEKTNHVYSNVTKSIEETHFSLGPGTPMALKEKLEALKPTPPTIKDFSDDDDADDSVEIKVIHRENLRTGEEPQKQLHIGGPFSPQEKKALQYLESLEDLRTMIEYTNDVKQMSRNMDQVIRDACAHRPKPKKKKAKEENTESKESAQSQATSDKSKGGGDGDTQGGDAKKDEKNTKSGDASASAVSKEKILSQKVEKWEREADVIKECTETMMPDNPKTSPKQKEEEALQKLKEIFGLTYDLGDISSVSVSPPPSPPGAKKKSGESKDKFTIFKLNAAPKELRTTSPESSGKADTKTEKKKETKASATATADQKINKPPKTKASNSTDRCVKISPNLTDDTKVELLQDDSTETKKTSTTSFQMSTKPSSDSSAFAALQFTTATVDGKKVLIPAGTGKSWADDTKPTKPKTTLHFDLTQGGKVESVKFGIKHKPKKETASTVEEKKGKGSPREKKSDLSKSKPTQDASKTNAEEGIGKTKTLRVCSGCTAVEPAPKTYKKCQKCKEQNIKSARYYCGRDCQVSDWAERHKKEHKDHMLQ